VRLRHDTPVVRVSFDDPNLVSCAGLLPVMRLAQDAGLHARVAKRVRIPGDKGANAGGKVATIVAGMVAGADSITDLNLVRHGGMPSLFTGVYAPSTVGEFLREFRHGHVRQLQAVGRDVLVELARRTPLLDGARVLSFVDIDSMLRRVYGKKKQGAGFGHAKVGGYNVWLRGYNPLIATLSTPLAAPVIAATQLRAGNAASARGAAWQVAEAIGTARACGATGVIVVRADSAFYAKTVIWACRRNGARFSVTARMDAKTRTACAAIGEADWVDIKYPQAIWDEDEQRWISDAQIAETTFTAFAGTRWQVTARLIVRRVKRLAEADQHPGQGELFGQYRYHAVFTDSPFLLAQAEEQHRGHAVIEQVNAELIDGPLAHLPSGRFAANNAWLACAAIAHNLTRAAGHLAGPRYATARPATIRTRIINVAARMAHRARGIHLHLPEHWPWQGAWNNLFAAAYTTPT
jgi:Transposase DDE domain group 1